MERSDKHGWRDDEVLKKETESLIRSGHSGRTEDWRDPEPSGEDQPEADFAPGTTLTGGVPAGLTAEDVTVRSELAAHLERNVYPAYRDDIVEQLVAAHASPRLVTAVRDLPGDTKVDSLRELTAALGLGHEEGRF